MAVVLIEIGMGTYRTEHFNEEQNNKQICLNLDLLAEKIELASRRAAEYQQRSARYYNQNLQIRQFKTGDWVLRRVNQNMKDPNHEVFGPNWEGPYRVL